MYLKCSKGMIKNPIPCQTVVNKMHIEHLPKELKDLERLEKILICKRILSEKIAIMFEKIELAKVKGSISYILAEAGNIQDKKETSIASLNDPLDFFKCEGNEQLLYKE